MPTKIYKNLKFNFILLITFLIFYFLGCQPTEKTRTLNITMSLGEEEWRVLREEIFPLFEKEHEIKINSYQIEAGQLATKLQALLEAGRSEIDLFAQDNMELSRLINQDLVLDLSVYQSRIPDEVLANLIDSCKFDGQLMFMPFRPNVQIIYYNQDAFKKYNLIPPKTWDELLNVAKTFKEKEEQGKVLLKAFGGNPTATQIYEFILQAGGDPYMFDDEGCVKAFTFLKELWPYVSEESRRAKWDTTNQILAEQQAYLAQNWPFGVIILVQEYNLPFIKTYSGWSGPRGEFHVIGGDVFGIPRNTPKKELALEFIQFMQSKEVQEILVSKLGWPSIRQDAYAKVSGWQEPYYQAVTTALKKGVFRKNVTWWPAYVKYISEAFREIVIGEAQVELTLKKYKEKLKKDKSLYK